MYSHIKITDSSMFYPDNIVVHTTKSVNLSIIYPQSLRELGKSRPTDQQNILLVVHLMEGLEDKGLVTQPSETT